MAPSPPLAAAQGNLQDARVAAAALASALGRAIWLDDDALADAAPAARVVALERRVAELKAELEAERSRADAADAAKAQAEADVGDARASLAAHVVELLARTDEVSALKQIIADLTGKEEEGPSASDAGGSSSSGLPSPPRRPRDRLAAAAADLTTERLAAEMLAAAAAEAEEGGGGSP
jgi:hypothetical protein